jgi:hypothetical protein
VFQRDTRPTSYFKAATSEQRDGRAVSESVLIREVLRVVSDGLATLEWVLIQLEPHAATFDIARAFQTARDREWIEFDPDYKAAGDPGYRLTATGLAVLAAARPPATGEPLRTGPQPAPGEPLSLESVLDVLADFDGFGGASIQLVAWELDVDETVVEQIWTAAVSDGLIERSGVRESDARHEMWRITERGRQTQDLTQERRTG